MLIPVLANSTNRLTSLGQTYLMLFFHFRTKEVNQLRVHARTLTLRALVFLK